MGGFLTNFDRLLLNQIEVFVQPSMCALASRDEARCGRNFYPLLGEQLYFLIEIQE